MQTLWQDLRYGARMLWKNPGFTIVAVITLALGIGANTAIFSVVNALLFRPLPFRDPERLVWIANTGTTGGLSSVTIRVANFNDWRAQNKSFEDLAAYFAFFDYGSYNLIGVGEPERLIGVGVSQNFFALLGVPPLLGRGFNEEECRWNGSPAVILGHAYWVRRFAADPAVIGRSLTLNDKSTTVVGVMPPTFDFASAFSPGSRVDILTPFPLTQETDRWGNTLAVIGRLKPGVTIAQAQSEFDLLNRQLKQAHPERWGLGAKMSGLQEQISGRFRRAFLVLFGAVGCVLLLGCANIANMQLSRAAGRASEIAVRLALGAGRARIIRQLLTESLLLSVVGGALGLLLALGGLELLRALGPDSIPRLKEATIDSWAIGFTAVLSALTSLLFGLAPAWQISKPDLQEALKESGRTAAVARPRRLHNALIIGQVSLALTLLTGAGLLIKSFWKLQSVSPGFDSDHILTAAAALSYSDYPNGDTQRRAAYFRQALERVRSLPGVESVGAISHLMFGGRTWQFPFEIKGREPLLSRQETLADFRVVTPAFFETLRIPLKKGRVFIERDSPQTPSVCLINETFARAYFPGRDPLGERLEVDGLLPASEIIGVVGDIRHRGLDAGPAPTIYITYLQHAFQPIMYLMIRTTGDPDNLASDVRRELQPIDPGQVIFHVQPLRNFLTESTAQRRFNALLLGLFAALALLLAVAGIYGVMAYTVTLRIHELGVRIALGAQSSDVLKLIIRQGMAPALTGVGIGLIAAAGLTRLMTNLLFEVSAGDPATYTPIALFLTFVDLLACWIPARRATKVDPLVALKCE